MRCWKLDRTPPLVFGECAVPQPGPGEVRVKVFAAGVTPTELLWYPTTHTPAGSPRADAVPGHEFSGTIDAVGDGVLGSAVGDAVFGMSDWFADGATADYCLTRPEHLAAKPVALTHAEAASVPIGALTAWQGLFDRAALKSGEHVLIHGGSGAVGGYAIQFARRAGARVTTTASTRNADYLRGLGAERVLDYRTDAFDTAVRDIDVVFDGVGGETLTRSWSVLRPGGRIVTIAADSEGQTDPRVKAAFFIVEPNATQLAMIAGQLQRQEITPAVDAVVPFAAAGEAYAGRVSGPRAGRGKVVVAVIG